MMDEQGQKLYDGDSVVSMDQSVTSDHQDFDENNGKRIKLTFD
jgi:hypothetical protein